MSFACHACDIILWDGVDYTWCPACGGPVDWFDVHAPLWCCPTCDAHVNDPRAVAPRCDSCDRQMRRLQVQELPGQTLMPGGLHRLALRVYLGLLVAQAIVMALDPLGRIALVPLCLLALIASVGWLAVVVANLGEVRALVRDRTNRVIHGLEHATLKLLEQTGLTAVGGQTHDGFFEITVRNEGRASIEAVRSAAWHAVRRIPEGDTALAYDPRCGTSLAVALSLIAVIVVAGGVVGLALGLDPGVVIAATIIAALAGWFAARPLGLLAQRAWTVSTDFRYGRVAKITRTTSGDGRDAIFLVHVVIDAGRQLRRS